MESLKPWTKNVSPERYLATWPQGPSADLARQYVNGTGTPSEVPEEPISKDIRFFSPKSGSLNIVVEPKEWMVVKTPAGERTIQSPGKTAQFMNNIFTTEDPEIIEYLTNTYADRRFPIVRDDLQTQSAHRYSK